MADKNLTEPKKYIHFAQDIGYDLHALRARAMATRALIENQDGYDGNDELVALGFLMTSMVNDLEAVADKVDDSSTRYCSKGDQHV